MFHLYNALWECTDVVYTTLDTARLVIRHYLCAKSQTYTSCDIILGFKLKNDKKEEELEKWAFAISPMNSLGTHNIIILTLAIILWCQDH